MMNEFTGIVDFRMGINKKAGSMGVRTSSFPSDMFL